MDFSEYRSEVDYVHGVHAEFTLKCSGCEWHTASTPSLVLADKFSFNALQVYDENGCQKTSALDAIDSNALSSLSGKLLDSQIPLYTASRPVDAAVKTENSNTSPQLSRRESALESIRRDSARSGSQVREPYVLSKDGASSIKIPDFLLDVAECLEGLEEILLEPPDLTDTAPFNEADFPPCWEEWELHDNTDPKRVSTLFADRPPDLQMPQSSEIKDPDPPKRTSMRPPALEIPPVTEPDTPIELGSPLIPDPSSTRPGGATGRMSQIDDPALQLEKLLLYTKTAAEAALRDLKLNSEANSPSSRRESALNLPSSRRESALNFDM